MKKQYFIRENQEIIPTEEYIPYDYGDEVNAKIKSLGWTAKQYDFFLDWLHQEKPVDDLVGLLLFYAPLDWFKGEADAIGLFDEEENAD